MSSPIAHYLDQAAEACPAACDESKRCLRSLTKSVTLYFGDQPITYDDICQVFGPPEQAVADCLAEPDATVLLLDARPRRKRLSYILTLACAALLTAGLLTAHHLLWSDAQDDIETYAQPVHIVSPIPTGSDDSASPDWYLSQ